MVTKQQMGHHRTKKEKKAAKRAKKKSKQNAKTAKRELKKKIKKAITKDLKTPEPAPTEPGQVDTEMILAGSGVLRAAQDASRAFFEWMTRAEQMRRMTPQPTSIEETTAHRNMVMKRTVQQLEETVRIIRDNLSVLSSI